MAGMDTARFELAASCLQSRQSTTDIRALTGDVRHTAFGKGQHLISHREFRPSMHLSKASDTLGIFDSALTPALVLWLALADGRCHLDSLATFLYCIEYRPPIRMHEDVS